MGPPAPHRPNVARRGRKRRLQDRDVELRVVGKDADYSSLVHLGRLQELVRPGHHDLVGGRETLAGGKDGPRVADGYPVAHEFAGPGHRAREVYRPEDVHSRRRGERLEKPRHALHPPLSARAEVDRTGASALEHTSRRLYDRPVKVFVASRSGVALWGDEQLTTQSRTFDQRGHRLTPAGEDLTLHQSTGSTKMWMMPPHVRPTPKASSSEMP